MKNTLLVTLLSEYPSIPRQIFSQYINDLHLEKCVVQHQLVMILSDDSELRSKLDKYLWSKTKRTSSGKENETVVSVLKILQSMKIKYQTQLCFKGAYRVDIALDDLLIEVKHNVSYTSVGQAIFYRQIFKKDIILVYGGKIQCAEVSRFAEDHEIPILMPTGLRRFINSFR